MGDAESGKLDTITRSSRLPLPSLGILNGDSGISSGGFFQADTYPVSLEDRLPLTSYSKSTTSWSAEGREITEVERNTARAQRRPKEPVFTILTPEEVAAVVKSGR